MAILILMNLPRKISGTDPLNKTTHLPLTPGKWLRSSTCMSLNRKYKKSVNLYFVKCVHA